MRLFLNITILLILSAIYGCRNSELDPIPAFLETLQSAASSEVSESDPLPEWLLPKIAEFESTPPTIIGIVIRKGVWEKQTVYFIRCNLYSCMFCDIYREDESRVVFPDQKAGDEFRTASRSWTIVYKYGKTEQCGY